MIWGDLLGWGVDLLLKSITLQITCAVLQNAFNCLSSRVSVNADVQVE